MIEHKFPYESLIGGWYISEKVCDNIIEFFNTNKKNCAFVPRINFHNDKSDGSIDLDVKESLDMSIYKKNKFYPFYDYREQLQICLNNYLKKYSLSNLVEPFDINENYNIQYYKPNQGFKIWHCERTGSKEKQGAKRHLVFMTYLNDVDDGGTEFFHQKLTCPAKKGLTILWPVDWTHTHKGQISKTKEKYIVTGWYSYNE